MPYVPIAARASARPAAIISSSARKRGRAIVSANTSSIVRSLTSGSVGSIVADHAPDVGGQRLERQLRSHDDVHVARGAEIDSPRPLVGEEIDLGPGLLRDAALLDVAHDADDREPRQLGAEPRLQPAAERSLVLRKNVLASVSLTSATRRAADVGRREIAAIDERESRASSDTPS